MRSAHGGHRRQVELEEGRAQGETRLKIAGPVGVTFEPFTRRKAGRRPLPDHLPRERVVYPVPSACPCCGGSLHKLGEDPSASLRAGVTETLQLVRRRPQGGRPRRVAGAPAG